MLFTDTAGTIYDMLYHAHVNSIFMFIIMYEYQLSCVILIQGRNWCVSLHEWRGAYGDGPIGPSPLISSGDMLPGKLLNFSTLKRGY